jgi:hypothetical protein
MAVGPLSVPAILLFSDFKEGNMSYIIFYGLAYRYAHKLITRQEFIEGWKAEQRHQGIEVKQ